MPKRRPTHSGNRTDNDSSLRQQGIFSRPSSRQRISEVFTKLADAFNKHAEYHRMTKSFIRPDEEEAKLPERCRKDLASVRALLPKLEKCFPPEQAVNCDASDLAHLCGFYDRVLRGVYCPHSPGLFQWGRVPADIMLRVRLLLHHSICPSVLANASTTQNKDRPAVAISISNTIAHLLSFLANDVSRKVIVKDLFSLLKDCAVVITGNILPSSILVWEQTSELCGEKSIACELMLDCLEEAWLLQTVAVTVLHVYLKMVKTKIIAADTSVNSSLDGDKPIPSGAVDMVFSPNLLDKTSLTFTLAILRHMLLSRSLSVVSNKHLICLRHFAALLVLKQLFKDWQLECFVPATLVEATVLVVRVSNEYLSSQSLTSKDNERMLLELLVEAMIHPPRVRGGSSFDDTSILVHRDVLLPLLECIKPITKRRNQMFSTLDSGIFRLIHIALHSGPLAPKILETAASLGLAHGIIPHIVDCLGDLNLVLYACGILSRIMDEGSLIEGTRGMAKFTRTIRMTKALGDPVAGSKRKRESQRKESFIVLQALEMSPSLRSPDRRIVISQEKQNSIGFNTSHCQMSSELRRLLEMALFAGRRLESWFKQESKRDNIKDRDIALLLGSIRLMLSQVWEHSTRIDNDTLTCCLDLIHILLKYLKGCCFELMKSDMKSWTPSHLSIAQAITSTGLYLYFFIEGIPSCVTKGHVHALKRVIEDFTHVASRLTLADFTTEAGGLLKLQQTESSHRNFSTSGILCQQWLETTECSDSEKVQADFWFSLVANATSPLERWEKSNHAKDLDRSVILFDLLPLRSRSCLLAYMNVPSINIEQESRDLFETVLGQKIPMPASSSPKEGCLWAVFYSPLYLSSLCRADTVKGSSCRDTFCRMISKLLKSSFEPMVRTIDLQEETSLEIVLQTLIRLKGMCDRGSDDEYFRFLHHPAAIVEYIFLRNDWLGYGLHSRTACQNLCGYMLSISKNVPQTHSSPSIRMLRWNCMAAACVGLTSEAIRLHAGNNTKRSRIQEPIGSSNSWLFWLLSVPFSDNKASVRRALSTKLHQLLMSDNYSLLFGLFGTSTDSKILTDICFPNKMEKATILGSNELIDASDRVVSNLFHSFDSLLLNVRSVADSQLSFTMSKSDETSKQDRQASSEKFLYQQTALTIFKSLCVHALLDNPVGVHFFEKSYIRLVRMWAAPLVEKVTEPIFPDLPTTPGSRGLAFGGFVFASRMQSLPSLIHADHLCPTFLATIFCDVLILSSSQTREVQFNLLQNFIQSSVTTTQSKSRKLMYRDTLALLDSQLPRIVCQFVIEKDVELLRLTTSFREFLDERAKEAKKKNLGNEALVGSSNESPEQKSSICDLNCNELDRRTKHLCLQPRMVERILPLVLIHSDRGGLLFFLSKVLSGISLKEILQNREQLILKELVWRLGGGNEIIGSVLQAIRLAATALLSETKRSLPRDDLSNKDACLASQWVTSHFMYLLVNVIQYRWKARTKKEQLQAIRCMYKVLNMLQPSESAQYFPQILQIATISGSEFLTLPASEVSHFHSLRLFAIKSLSKFVQLVSESQLEIIASNLTTIVVTLIPIITENIDENETSGHWALDEAQAEAARLLLFLASGDVGKALSRCFNDVPFLPQLPLLNSVHEALRKNKVDFDNLPMLSSPTHVDDSSKRATVASDLSSAMESKSTTSQSYLENLNGLQRRIHTMTTLLDNENIGVRNVVLDHLTSILRANRETFHKLVEDEGSDSMKHKITVTYNEKSPKEETRRPIDWTSQGTIVNLMENLLLRCVQETDTKTRISLAKCLGEVGAISELKIGDLKIGVALDSASVDSPNSMYKWRLEQPPWQSRAAKYELQLVTKHLVIALRSAPSSADQHKIAFTIQQLLVLLDRSARQDEDGHVEDGAPNTSAMSKWLRNKLIESNVLEVVEPFWFSEFHEKSEGYVTKEPPFFETSNSYYTWLSNFCRWMVSNSYSDEASPWRTFFHACRTAIRTHAGVALAEFILPLLLLDRICFGSDLEEEAIRAEMLGVFTSKSPLKAGMNQSDHQRAVNVVFMMMDTLNYWEEREVEDRFKSSRSNSASARRRATGSKAMKHDSKMSAGWPADKSLSRIEDLLSNIPLSIQAESAARVGMHARALRLLEMAGRLGKVEEIFESNSGAKEKGRDSGEALVGCANNAVLMKEILASLDDCETLLALRGDTFTASPSVQARDSIRQKEASGDFEGALQDYERAMQLEDTLTKDITLRRGILQCQLELGQFESVLNQVAGLTSLDHSQNTPIASFAVEAAWRLGRWEALSDLVAENDKKSRKIDVHDFSIGKAMVGLYKRDEELVRKALESARLDVMEDLSSMARESYSKSYAHMVRLQCIRELEDASSMLCHGELWGPLTLSEVAHSTVPEGWAWTERLKASTAQGASRVITSRVAIARLSKEPALEASLFLNIGKRARKRQLHSIAENFFSQAQAAFAKIPTGEIGLGSIIEATSIQVAKLKHATGESALALKILGHESMQCILDEMFQRLENQDELKSIAVKYERQRLLVTTASKGQVHESEDALADRFAKRLLRLTQWTVEGGLRGGSEITRRYQIIHKLAPTWGKGHFHFGKYIDSMMQSRVAAMTREYFDAKVLHGVDEDLVRTSVIYLDAVCQGYILSSMRHYAISLRLDSKHVYQALPRLLSLWFDFTSIDPSKQIVSDGCNPSEQNKQLSKSKNEANKLMANNLKEIPSASFYTAIPQLVSRVTHHDGDTAIVVYGILKRVLIKFPQQAMWPLACLKGSKQPDRQKIGEKLFKEAQTKLGKINKNMQQMLLESPSLFKFLKELATATGDHSNSTFVKVKPWTGGVDLCEFVAPVQAALSIAPMSNSSSSKDYFPRNIPRMRAFSSRVAVMSSKARPKRITAFAVPGSFQHAKRSREPSKTGHTESSPQSCDVGEIHFLVKQEAKGDLRKDARVQDLNNVINRLMVSSGDRSRSARRRRLHLRTFAVTCLSEDTGILEWVPETNSLRNLVEQAYNPQASPFCPRRRGARLANFGDASLRSNYNRCQSTYFKNGNLLRATQLFQELCLKQYPPLLYWWFVQKFHDPNSWYEAKNRFTLSAAVWSAVGHVIGLGDRHSENILVDTTTGECVHVDFDCIFDKGLNLPKPEVIPFRLTANMVDAFGPTGAEGIYSTGLQIAMRILRDNRDLLLSVLEPFLKDPVIDWKRYRSQQKGHSSTDQAKRSIKVIDERLRGLYNLRNPNLKKYSRTDFLSSEDDDELTHLVPMSVEGQVNKMITEATAPENLVQLYVGWMPWL